MRLVSDIMTRSPQTLYPDQTVDDAADLAARFRHVPVVSHEPPGRLVGLLTQRDLWEENVRAFLVLGAMRERLLRELRVSDIMQQQVQTASPHEPAVEAGRRMAGAGLGCLPVVAADGTVVGILTKADYMRAALELLDEPLVGSEHHGSTDSERL